jgi:pilus assembly protein CpaB
VTLDTDPKQAQNIIVAREAGRFTALLRNPQDKTPTQGGQGDLTALLGATPIDSGSGDLEVPVLYGGRSAKLPPEGLRLRRQVQLASTSSTPPQSAAAGSTVRGEAAIVSPAAAGTPPGASGAAAAAP